VTPNRHPSEAILAAYAAGSLAEGLALVTATHLSLCASCRSANSAIEAIGGAVFDSLPGEPMREDALAHALARIERPDPASLFEAGLSTPSTGLAELSAAPEPLRHYLGGRGWRGWVPGLAAMRIMPRDQEGGSVFLVRVSPGMALAHHGHGGRELSLILSGAYRDEFGRFGPGDLAEIDETMCHRPVAEAGAPCICVIATERPLRFTGRLARALQPMLGL
jgi:putative transcriptional regulator